uniref:Variant surface glycoprotein (VSG), putative n=1 Tax=Trypanosoma brucei brucei (strain 927/4 GUTat10.1) TaxID=185431 RepID=Q4FKD1_TRYB2|nr:variant surface glycoprotein (VSG), putative [Trypanosoma brucei brucei TREU927]
MQQTLLAILLATSSKVAYGANLVTGQNSRQYGALCDIVRFTTSKPTIPPKLSVKTSAYTDILERNMSLAPADWKGIFRNPKNSKEWRADMPEEKDQGPDWQEKWQDWVSAIQAVEETNGNPKPEKEYFKGLTPAQIAQARAQMTLIADTAFELVKSTQPETDTERLSDETALQKALNKLATGDDDAKPEAATLQQIYSTENGPSARDGGCTVGSGNDKPTRALGALACVCVGETSTQADDICYKGQTTTEVWGNSRTITIAHLQTLAKSCGKIKPQQITSAKLRALVDNVISATTTAGTHTYLGAFLNNCDGKQANGRCIKWPSKKQDTIEDDEHTPWLRDLAKLATAVSSREAANGQAIEVGRHLNNLLAQAKALPAAVKHVLKTNSPAQSGQKENTGSPQGNTECSAHHGSNATCPHDKCTYDGKENKCNPIKPVEAAGPAGTAEGAAATTTEKCKGKDEKTCGTTQVYS